MRWFFLRAATILEDRALASVTVPGQTGIRADDHFYPTPRLGP
jgi:hypothetical protein